MTRKVAAALVAALALTGIAAPVALGAKKMTLSGSTSMAPLIAKLGKAFVKGEDVKINLLQGGSDVGITDVSRGRVTLGMSSRDPKPADPGGIVFNKIARDGVCVVTNKDNKIPNLSRNQVQDIFSGRIRTWSRVDGAGVSGPINLVVRTAASGTQDAFQQIFMGEDLRVAGSATTKSSNGLLSQTVASNPQAIGYASFNFTGGLWDVPFAGVPCNLRNAKSGEYGGVRNFFLVSRGRAKGTAKEFIDFARHDRKAQKIIAKNWVPL
jgi:phosphate transport system substrate-binding protein